MNNNVKERHDKWLNEKFAPKQERKKAFKFPSGIELKPLYMPKEIDIDKLGFPGEYPFTRGVYPTMYRERLWTKRLLAGYGDPFAFNERVKFLLKSGETGIAVPAPGPSLRGYDTDQIAEELDKGYIGLYGTPFDTLEDVELSFADIPIDEISVNCSDPGPFISIAMIFALAKKRGILLNEIRGTTNQSDCLCHYINAHGAILFPLEAHMKLTIDHIKWCTLNAPKWHPVSLIGYHAEEAGGNAVQEVAFTMADGASYLEECIKAGLNVDDVARRIGGFFAGSINFFETIAKLRAARRIWAKITKERFGAKDPQSWQLPIHIQTSGAELTWQNPLLNIARVAIQALAAVLGGAQSIHTNSYDEAVTVPVEEAALIALMTQHVISDETRVADVIDPLGGCPFVESLTDEIEKKALNYIKRIDEMGGMVQAVKSGYIYREITEAIARDRIALKEKEKIIVGVNEYIIPEKEGHGIARVKPNEEAIDRHLRVPSS